MKDKHGNDLPEPKRVFHWTVRKEDKKGITCQGCKRRISGGKGWEMRMYGFDGEKHPVQGPLCPNCSELPPEQLPSRRFTERWW